MSKYQDVRMREIDMDIVQQMAVHFGVSLSDMHPLVVNVRIIPIYWILKSIATTNESRVQFGT